jgi:glucose/arabinose dehydrogenase
MRKAAIVALAGLVATAMGCTTGSTSPFAGFGRSPPLPAPSRGLPSINVAKAVGWPPGAAPTAPAGFRVTAFGSRLDHPRWLLVLPNGDVLVAESSSEPGKIKSIKDWFMQKLQKRGGALQASPNRIILLRDGDGDGVAETRTVFAQGLKRPFGMTLVGGTLYVANDDSIVSFPYRDGQTSVAGPGARFAALPGGPINHHWTKNILATPDGRTLYAAVGSNSNVGENGMAAEKDRAAIHSFDLATGQSRVFASGLRNPAGMDFEPVTGALWTVVNERDTLGDDLVPDYMTRVREGAFYGWPYSYYGPHVDARAKPPRPDLVARAIAPDYGLGSHTASLGLTFYRGEAFPPRYRGGAFVGQHGSWNRNPLSGYRVVFIPFADGAPTGPPEVFLSGFLNARNEARGRPVGVTVDKRGALLVADDAGDTVWRVAAEPAAPQFASLRAGP